MICIKKEEKRALAYLIYYLLDYAACTWKHRCEEMGVNHLSILFHIPNNATNKKQHSYFPSRDHCTDDNDDGGYASDIGIHLYDKN